MQNLISLPASEEFPLLKKGFGELVAAVNSLSVSQIDGVLLRAIQELSQKIHDAEMHG